MEEKKWFLVSPYKGKRNVVIYGHRKDYKMFSEGGEITSKSRTYDTKEDLYKDKKIHSEPCIKCSSLISLNYSPPYGEQLKEKKLCFSCNHWDEILKRIKHPNTVIVNGMSYWVEKDDNSEHPKFKGHGGRLFRIKKHGSDKIIETRNLWCQGEIPKEWLSELPDNAIFIEN